jgi:hypothetical protein
VTVYATACRDSNPAFADAILLDVCSLLSIEANSDGALENLLVVVGTVRVDTQPIW